MLRWSSLILVVVVTSFLAAACSSTPEDSGPLACADLCVTPPAAECVDDLVVRFNPFGECQDGVCIYPPSTEQCEHGCSGGVCLVPDPCDGVVCDPESQVGRCSGRIALNPGAGTCEGGECGYEELRVDCADTARHCQMGGDRAQCYTPAATCDDRVQNAQETDVDCGGAVCNACLEGDRCQAADDCEGVLDCVSGECRAPTCGDDVHNGVETDVDCGGRCRGCEPDEACLVERDCQSGVCEGRVCVVGTCEDRVVNQDESDIDCGGVCGVCEDGAECNGDDDCESSVCSGGRCRAPRCSDRTTNGTETDQDCGGDCDPCEPGATCSRDADCTVRLCDDEFVCAERSCLDREMNGDETGVDCGGECNPCLAGTACDRPSDCISGVCGEDGLCQVDTCEDEVENGRESDVDCGGPGCPRCASGEKCLLDTDCDPPFCSSGVCAEATCFDDELTEGETDVDCGGACRQCTPGALCEDHDDCLVGLCAEILVIIDEEETTQLRCAPPACDDGIRNGTETSIDCGGSNECDRCGEGEGCEEGSDCMTMLCDEDNALCLAGSCDDRVKNGLEGDVDCGRGCDPCALGRTCGHNADCVNGRCVEGRCAATCDDEVNNGSESDVDCGGNDCDPCELDEICSRSSDCEIDNCINFLCKEPTCEDGVENGDEEGIDCGVECGVQCVIECNGAHGEYDLEDFVVEDGLWRHSGVGDSAPTVEGFISYMTFFNYECGESTPPGPEVAYRFEVPATGSYLITTDVDGADSTADTVLYVLPWACTTGNVEALDCNDDIGEDNVGSEITVELTEGDVVFIIVDGRNDIVNATYALEVQAQ